MADLFASIFLAISFVSIAYAFNLPKLNIISARRIKHPSKSATLRSAHYLVTGDKVNSDENIGGLASSSWAH